MKLEIMDINTFCNLQGFSSNERIAAQNMFSEHIDLSFEEWVNQLKNDFNLNKNSLVKDVEKMTLQELKRYALKSGVTFENTIKKKELIKKIKEETNA